MGRVKKKDSESVNVTKERLAGTPFSSKAEMDQASEEIRKEIWTQLEKVRIKNELLQKPEFKSFLRTFEKGLGCKFSDESDLFRIYLNSLGGIDLNINEEMKSESSQMELLSTAIRSASDTFLSNYLKSLDIVTGKQIGRAHV